MSEEKIEEKYKKAAQVIIRAGILPFPLTDTLLEIIRYIIREEDLDFIMAFKRKFSQTMEQLKKSSKMSEKEILEHVKFLSKKGVIFNQPNSEGIMVYRLLPLMMVGPFEYLLMEKIGYTEQEKRLAILFKKLFDEAKELIHEKYEMFIPIFKKLPPIDRTVPVIGQGASGEDIKISVNKEVDVPEEEIIPIQKVEELINKFDDIAVGHCFCRQHKDLLGDPCKVTDLRENCFTFGKSARFCVEQGFQRMISKDEALKVLKASEEDGLVHKAFHPHSDILKDETSICNCCVDCCATFELWRDGVLPLINSTYHLSSVNREICVGCGTCVEKCTVGAISLNDNEKAEVDQIRCIGCGLCAHFCPQNAITLLEGMRKVYVPPLRD
ncbi:MAG: 4Fe-4S dicluster domain-containing protein [Promethearchaeota archaeon]|nr:MAG: 4Fe-4S dicluster domain-containing protein [Candidatus Lokiarchaeota archaeon]